ncbi:UNVERIFIED_CONTAM: hypothetical protein HDU68_007649 [Siphonaria sp. JEL0065]|nr:hypothetical protein HDU68_007649 [Siphonaria sp. JEL0065]
MQILPNELIERILRHVQPVETQFRLATSLRFLVLRDSLLFGGVIEAATVDTAAKHGRIELLDRLFSQREHRDLEFSAAALDGAAANGHVNTCVWFKKKGLKLKHSKAAVDWASRNGHIHILNWWRDNVPTCKYSMNAMDWAAKYNQTDVIMWWVNESGLPLRYTEALINYASKNDNIELLRWWFNHYPPLDILYNAKAMDWASSTRVLDFWKHESGVPHLLWTSGAMDKASAAGRIDLLQWWVESGLELKWKARAIDWASEKGYNHVLQWWVDSGLRLLYSSWAVDWASQSGHTHTLEWWVGSGLELKFSDQSIVLASLNGHVAVLDWWDHHSDVDETITWEVSPDILSQSPQSVLDWWRDRNNRKMKESESIE